MFRYIHSKFWTDPKIKKLAPDEKLIFLYLITNSHAHLSGIYYLPFSLMEYETGLNITKIRRGIDTLSIGHLIRIDSVSDVIWVIKMLRYQGSGSKIIASVASQLSELHNCPLIQEFLEYYKDLNIPYRYPIDTPSIKEKEKEKEKEKDKYKDKNILLSGKTPCPTHDGSKNESSISKNKPKNNRNPECDEAIDYLNEKTGKEFRKIERNRIHPRARLREGFEVSDLKKVVDIKLKDDYFQEHPQFMRPQTLWSTKMEAYLQEEKDNAKRGFQNWVPPDS